MKYKIVTIGGMFFWAFVCGANAASCIRTTFNVTYSCGDGTQGTGDMPADTVAEYNKTFTPASSIKSICNPPEGSKINGYAVYVNGVEMASFTSASFKYSFATDCEIRPNYISTSNVYTLVANLYVGGSEYDYDKETQTWSVIFPYGIVSGVSKCSELKPESTALGYYTGLIASDQDAIENADDSGQYCYCKLTEPMVSGSPWVFYKDSSSASGCASNCANLCGYGVNNNVVNGRRFRASVFQAAVDEVMQ